VRPPSSPGPTVDAKPGRAIVTGPGRTSLEKGEFIVEFRVPKPKPHQSDAYLRFIPRTEMDIAVVGVGVNVTLDGNGMCTDARVVLGAVAPTQVVADEAAAALVGHRLDAEPGSSMRRRSRHQADQRRARRHRDIASRSRRLARPRRMIAFERR
jgi:CO/xanthine dehydrogenase FAD-binding subunit